MKKINLLLLLSFFFMLSCNQKKETTEQTDVTAEVEESTADVTELNEDESTPQIGRAIYGDFDGNGTFEYAYLEQTREAEGDHPLCGGIAAEYAVKFLHDSTLIIPIGCCEATLIYEGDLNGDGSDEFSIFQAPMNGCTYVWQTFTYSKGKWVDLFDLFLYPTACDPVSDELLLDMVTLENGIVYYKSFDPNDEDRKLVKNVAIKSPEDAYSQDQEE